MKKRQAKKVLKKAYNYTNNQLSSALLTIHGGSKRDTVIDILKQIKNIFSDLKPIVPDSEYTDEPNDRKG